MSRLLHLSILHGLSDEQRLIATSITLFILMIALWHVCIGHQLEKQRRLGFLYGFLIAFLFIE